MNVNQLSGLLRSVFFFLGFCPGLVVTLSFISGDEQGRVNLLYLLILFVFLPCLRDPDQWFSFVFALG